MRKRFEKDIKEMNEKAKDVVKQDKQVEAAKEAGADLPDEKYDQIDDLDGAIRYMLRKTSERQATGHDVQKEIFQIQVAKQEVMDRLRARLKAIKHPEADVEAEKGPPADRTASYRKGGGVIRYKNDVGEDQTAKFADIVGDLKWGVTYDLDDTVPEDLRKKYAFAQAKNELQQMLDAQIFLSETKSGHNDDGLKETYIRTKADREKNVEQHDAGMLAEKMVMNTFAKLSLRADMPFKVKEADFHEDLVKGRDFVVVRKGHTRGVKTEAGNLDDKDAIQFSMTTNPAIIEKKKRQLVKAKRAIEESVDEDEVDDQLLVILPIERVRNMLRQWIAEGRPAGGPEKNLGRDSGEELFRRVLAGIMNDGEITEAWAKVAKDFK